MALVEEILSFLRSMLLMLSYPLLFLFFSFSIVLSISCSEVGLRNSDYSFLFIFARYSLIDLLDLGILDDRFSPILAKYLQRLFVIPTMS